MANEDQVDVQVSEVKMSAESRWKSASHCNGVQYAISVVTFKRMNGMTNRFFCQIIKNTAQFYMLQSK